LKEHTVPDSAHVLNLDCTFERDTRVGLPATTGGNAGWTVRSVIDGHEYLIGLHYNARDDAYYAAGRCRGFATWEYAMERDGVPALNKQADARAKLNGR
jgi:hypothetical protein